MFNKIHDFVFYIVSTLYFARLIWNCCLSYLAGPVRDHYGYTPRPDKPVP